MTLTSKELLNEFIKQNKLAQSLETIQVKEIAYGPWEHLSNMMRGEKIDSMRIKYFGNFLVKPRKAKVMRVKIEKTFKEGKVTEEKYLEEIRILDNYLKTIEHE